MTKIYAFYYRLLASLIRKLYRVEIIGEENIPKEGKLLVCGNHTSIADVFILGACMPRQVRFLAKAELFRIPILSSLIKSLGAFPVKRGQADLTSIRTVLHLLGEGEVVGMYPQGHRYPGVHPEETPTKPGVGMLVYRSGATVLPFGLSCKGYRPRIFRKTVIRFGAPITGESLAITSPTPSEYERATSVIFSQICALVEKQETKAPQEKKAKGKN